MTRLRALFLVISAGLLVAALSGCGGGSDTSSELDPKQVYEQTFSGSKDYSSGVLDLELEISSEGSNAGDLTVQLSGPFESTGAGSIPKFDFDAKISGRGASSPSFDFNGELISTGTQGFVVKDGTAYSVDPRSFKTFSSFYEQGGRGLQFPPLAITSNLQNEGIEQVEGTDTIHISGDLDPGKLVNTLQSVSEAAGRRVPGASQLKALQGSIKQARLDLYSGVDDQRVHRFVLDSETGTPSGDSSSSDSSAFKIDITLSELGEAQTIEAPSDAQPLSTLLQGGGSGGASGSDGGSSGSGSGGTKAYLDCLQTAKDQTAAQACQDLLP